MEEMKLVLNRKAFDDKYKSAYKSETKGLLPKVLLGTVLLALITAWGLNFAYAIYINYNLVDVLSFCLYVLGIAIAIYGFGALMKLNHGYFSRIRYAKEHCSELIYGNKGSYTFLKDCIKFVGKAPICSTVKYSDVKRILIWDDLIGIDLKDSKSVPGFIWGIGIHTKYYENVDVDALYEFLKDKDTEVIRLKDDTERQYWDWFDECMNSFSSEEEPVTENMQEYEGDTEATEEVTEDAVEEGVEETSDSIDEDEEGVEKVSEGTEEI